MSPEKVNIAQIKKNCYNNYLYTLYTPSVWRSSHAYILGSCLVYVSGGKYTHVRAGTTVSPIGLNTRRAERWSILWVPWSLGHWSSGNRLADWSYPNHLFLLSSLKYSKIYILQADELQYKPPRICVLMYQTTIRNLTSGICCGRTKERHS
jgi:hypothetical protein